MRLLPQVRRPEVSQCAALLRVYMAWKVAQIDDTAIRPRGRAAHHDGIQPPIGALPRVLLFVWPIERGRYRATAHEPV